MTVEVYLFIERQGLTEDGDEYRAEDGGPRPQSSPRKGSRKRWRGEGHISRSRRWTSRFCTGSGHATRGRGKGVVDLVTLPNEGPVGRGLE